VSSAPQPARPAQLLQHGHDLLYGRPLPLHSAPLYPEILPKTNPQLVLTFGEPISTTFLTKSPRSFSVRLWNAKSGELLHRFTAHTDVVYRNIVN